jgi:hypothetical protein
VRLSTIFGVFGTEWPVIRRQSRPITWKKRRQIIWKLTFRCPLYPARQCNITYKALWTVEDIIRTAKSILETRPIYHKCNETIRGHVFCSFLALLLKTELERRMKFADLQYEWAQVLRGLKPCNRSKPLLRTNAFCFAVNLTVRLQRLCEQPESPHPQRCARCPNRTIWRKCSAKAFWHFYKYPFTRHLHFCGVEDRFDST